MAVVGIVIVIPVAYVAVDVAIAFVIVMVVCCCCWWLFHYFPLDLDQLFTIIVIHCCPRFCPIIGHNDQLSIVIPTYHQPPSFITNYLLVNDPTSHHVSSPQWTTTQTTRFLGIRDAHISPLGVTYELNMNIGITQLGKNHPIARLATHHQVSTRLNINQD